MKIIPTVNFDFKFFLENDWTYLENKSNSKNLSWNVINDMPIDKFRQIKTIVFNNV